MKNIYSTFGSKELLQSIQKEHSDHNLLLLEPTSFDKDFQLLDFSNLGNVFEGGTSYEEILDCGNLSSNYYFVFNYFSLTSDDVKEFQNLMNQTFEKVPKHGHLILLKQSRIQYTMLSIWDDKITYDLWRKSEHLDPLNKFMSYLQATSGNYSATYLQSK